MKRILSGFLMALSTYSIIPVPISVWRDDVWPIMAAFLPAVGAVTGAIWLLIAYLLTKFGVPSMIAAVVLCLYPHIITGFFHLDGYMDCADAVLSRRDLETRRRILKDSHVGAFAVISLAVLLLVTFAFWGEMRENVTLLPLLFAPIACRCVSAYSVTMLRPLSTSQYSDTQKSDTKIHCAAAVICEFFLAAAFAAIFGVLAEMMIPAAVSVIAVFLLTRSFQGMSGDIAGGAVTIGEAAAAITVSISSLIAR